MIGGKSVTICLPCRNEGSHLPEVLKRIPKKVDQIIIVSNKSVDDTVKVANELARKDKRIKVIEDNRTIGGIGYGFAHMSAIQATTSDIIVGADGDATYPIEELETIVGDFIKNDLNFMSCNRYPLKDGTKIPFKLRFGVGALNWETRLLYGIKVKDILSGMWVFKREVRDDLNLTMGEWNLSPQIKINAARNRNIGFIEYGIAQHQRLGDTKQNYFKTGFSHAIWILKNRFLG